MAKDEKNKESGDNIEPQFEAMQVGIGSIVEFRVSALEVRPAIVVNEVIAENVSHDLVNLQVFLDGNNDSNYYKDDGTPAFMNHELGKGMAYRSGVAKGPCIGQWSFFGEVGE